MIPHDALPTARFHLRRLGIMPRCAGLPPLRTPCLRYNLKGPTLHLFTTAHVPLNMKRTRWLEERGVWHADALEAARIYLYLICNGACIPPEWVRELAHTCNE